MVIHMPLFCHPFCDRCHRFSTTNGLSYLRLFFTRLQTDAIVACFVFDFTQLLPIGPYLCQSGCFRNLSLACSSLTSSQTSKSIVPLVSPAPYPHILFHFHMFVSCSSFSSLFPLLNVTFLFCPSFSAFLFPCSFSQFSCFVVPLLPHLIPLSSFHLFPKVYAVYFSLFSMWCSLFHILYFLSVSTLFLLSFL